MNRYSLTLGICVAVVEMSACERRSEAPAGEVAPPTSQAVSTDSSSLACDLHVLGRALAFDSTRMRRVRREEETGAPEGVTLTLFSEGHEPRIISATYLAETGQTTLRYYLLDSANFVVDREEVDYAAPISEGGPTTIRSRIRQFYYFCGGRALPPVDSAHLSDLRPRLDSLRRALPVPK